MKELTINRISLAGIKANKKQYRSLVITLILAVFLVTVITICVGGSIEAVGVKVRSQVGNMDSIIFDAPDITDETLRDSGLFSKVGRLSLAARESTAGFFVGYSDAEADKILMTACIEGRLPERGGEIAIEQSALEVLREEKQVGDTLTLLLTPISGEPEEKTFTIVGILREQEKYISMPSEAYGNLAEYTELSWPNARISPQERFKSGTTITHRVMIHAPLVTFSQVFRYHSEYPGLYTGQLFAVSRYKGRVYSRSDVLAEDVFEYANRIFMLVLLGTALLISCCVAMSFSTENVLAGKTEDVAMMRAVGATRKQIRRVFGRQIWLLFLPVLPAGVILGIPAAFLICGLSSGEMVFTLSLWLLLPVVFIPALCILLAGTGPLKRASWQSPLGVLRDTGTLRRAAKIKEKIQFRPGIHIALRQLRLHPLRQAGNIIITAFSLICMALLLAFSYVSVFSSAVYNPDFELGSNVLLIHSGRYSFADVADSKLLTRRDIEQIRSIEQVREADETAAAYVNLLVEGEIPDYFRTYEFGYTTDHFDGIFKFNAVSSFNDPEMRYLEADEDSIISAEPETIEKYQEMKAFMAAFDINKRPVMLPVIVLSDEKINRLSEAIVSGKIDIDALDRGDEILVNAPNEYIIENDDGYIFSSLNKYGGECIYTVENDYFFPGKELDLLQVIMDKELIYDTEADYSLYSGMKSKENTVKVGAVISNNYPSGTFYDVGFYTTEKGAEALGLTMNTPMTVEIYLNGSVDSEAEELLEQRLTRIAMRGNLEVTNYLKRNRESMRERLRTILFFGGLTVLFFAVSVVMQAGNAGRRIRSEQRTIGTLRAVGADEKTLSTGYLLNTVLLNGAGIAAVIILLVILYLSLGDNGYLLNRYPPFWLEAAAVTVLGFLCGVCSYAGIRAKLREALKKSVVENIREL